MSKMWKKGNKNAIRNHYHTSSSFLSNGKNFNPWKLGGEDKICLFFLFFFWEKKELSTEDAQEGGLFIVRVPKMSKDKIDNGNCFTASDKFYVYPHYVGKFCDNSLGCRKNFPKQ